ncbi:MAG TPA: hypothetical protein VMW38_20935, partial [Terriglobia bacterium]|nr:hypothetical protein [Terriglobia bacterium]
MRFTPSIVAHLCLLVAPLWAQSPLGKFVYKFQDPRVIQLLEVRGANAEWSKTIGDGAPIDRPEDALPSVPVGALHLVLGSTKEYGILELTEASSLLSDWTGYDRLAFSVENASDFMIPIDLTVRDKTGTSYSSGHIWLSRARNRLEIPLEEIRDSKGHALDLAHIRSLRIDIHSAEKFERDLWFYNFYLAPARRPSIEATPRRMLLDFGPTGSPLIAGAKLVTEKTAYAPFRGYGWTEIPGDAQAWLAHRPDRLTGDWVWADLGGNKASLRVDLPDGDYRARLYGGNYSSKLLPVRSFQLNVAGQPMAAREVDPATFYTEAEYFRGMNHWYEEGEDTYRKSVAGLYQTYDFPFKVRGGHIEFVWRGVMAVFGLLIAPEGAEFEKAADRVEYVRKQEFLSNLQRPTPPEQAPAASDEEKRRGFLVWSRSYEEVVGPYDRPAAREQNPGTLRLAAARSDHAHVTVTATPLRALGSLQASLSELRNDTGAVLPSHDLQLRALKYMWDGWPATLGEGCLFPSGAVPSRDNVNVTFWISVTPDNSVIGGSYRGRLSLTAEKGGSVVLPLEITVYPFTLADNHPVSYAFYRGSDFNQSYSLRYFLPQKIQYYRRLLQAEITTMKSHG